MNEPDPAFTLTAAHLKKSLGLIPAKPSSNVSMKRIPWIGSLHFVRDKEGILCLSFTVLYWVYGVFTTYFMILQPQSIDGRVAGWFNYYYLTVAGLCLSSLFRASTLNPGRVPLVEDSQGVEPENWVFCDKCQRKRPHRAHHCRRCQQCVLKMDHHCPWINNCVGEGNQYQFILLNLYAFMLSANTFLVCMAHFWVLPKCVSCDREAFYIKHSILFLYLTVVLAVCMSIFMTTQLLAQHFNILINRTTIETMGMGKTPDINSIKVQTCCQGYSDVFGTGNFLLWIFPCRQRKSRYLALSNFSHV